MTVYLRMCPARGLWATVTPVQMGMEVRRARPLCCPQRPHQPRGWLYQRRDTPPPKHQGALWRADLCTSHQHAKRSGTVCTDGLLHNLKHMRSQREPVLLMASGVSVWVQMKDLHKTRSCHSSTRAPWKPWGPWYRRFRAAEKQTLRFGRIARWEAPKRQMIF